MTGTSKREICRPGQRVTGVDEVNGVGGVDHLWLAFSKDKYIYIYQTLGKLRRKVEHHGEQVAKWLFSLK